MLTGVTTTTGGPLPDGFTLRPVRYPDDGPLEGADLDAVTDLVHRSEAAVLGAADTTRAEMQEVLSTPDILREESYLVESDGVVVAGGWHECDEPGREFWSETFVAPELPGAAALREALVGRSVELGRRWIGERTGWKLRAGAYEPEQDQREALVAQGFTLVRRFWRMEIASDSPAVPAQAPALPPGVTVEAGDSEDHRRALWEADQEAFADHWNYVPRDFDDTWGRILVEPGARAEYWWLVRVDGRPAGLCMLNDSRLEAGHLYVSTLGIAPGYRRRGLARMLLQRSFVLARDAGLAGTSLHVDAQSVTGATALYESVGMRASMVIDSFELPV